MSASVLDDRCKKIKKAKGETMIQREDMLELTRRMTPARSCISRIAGAYFDEEGYVDGTFNTNFLRLSLSERTKQLALAKTVPFSDTKFPERPGVRAVSGSFWTEFFSRK